MTPEFGLPNKAWMPCFTPALRQLMQEMKISLVGMPAWRFEAAMKNVRSLWSKARLRKSRRPWVKPSR